MWGDGVGPDRGPEQSSLQTRVDRTYLQLDAVEPVPGSLHVRHSRTHPDRTGIHLHWGQC